MKNRALTIVMLLCLSACTSQQAYSSGQAWQRNECGKIVDQAEYSRCMARADTSYDTYRKETGQK